MEEFGAYLVPGYCLLILIQTRYLKMPNQHFLGSPPSVS